VKVRDLPEAQRPRERMLKLGAVNLQDRELLALMLGSGLPGRDAIELGAVLIDYAGDLSALARVDPYVLTRVPGVGIAKAVRVAGAFELGRRAVDSPARRRITRSTDVAEEATPYLRGLRHERVVVIVCDNNGGLLRTVTLTEGGNDRSLLPVRDVLHTVLSSGGARFAVAHNHPSGSLEPSKADVEITARLRAAAETVGLRFLDHVIVTETEWSRIP
jgi:DNA repair protein RadC